MLSGRCANHPERVAIGVCVNCRRVICIECSTPMDGIHRCNRCVGAMAKKPEATRWNGSEAHPAILGLLAFSLGGLFLYFMGLSAVLWP